MRDVNEVILAARCEHFAVVREAEGAHRPLEPRKRAHTHELARVPKRNDGVCGADCEVFSVGRELQTDGVGRVGVQDVFQLQTGIAARSRKIVMKTDNQLLF